jgi:glycerol-3-phosphate acyltransferase PlsY
MVELLVKTLIGYLAGSVVGSLVLGRLRGVDIRGLGSGNAGGTNALRTQGKLFALGVVLIDVSKAVIPVALLPGAELPGVPTASGLRPDLVGAVVGAAAVVGHCYPVFFGFRGGKGMATLLGAYAVLAPIVLLPMVIAWLAVVMASGYVGLATMVAAASAPIWFAIRGAGGTPLFWFSVGMAAFLVFTHRQNIGRRIRGQAHRARALMPGRKP